MKRILSQCSKELAQFRRDRLTLALAFILPFMTLLIFGFAIRLEAKDIPLYIQDFSQTPLSNAYIERLFATNQFVPIEPSKFSLITPKIENPQDAIDQGLAHVAVTIPPEFSTNLKVEKPTQIQVLVDGTDANNARVIRNSIKATTDFFLQQNGFTPSQRLIAPRIRLWFNPGRKEHLYIVPGLYAVILWIYPSLLSSIAMVREKEKGTILQVYASSLTATELLLGKGLAYLLIGISEAIFIMVSGGIIWQLPLAGNLVLLMLATLIFLVDSVLFGLLIGVRTGNQNAAIQAVSLVGFLTALLLSGFIYPLSNIPFPLSLISSIVPARYFVEISRDAYVRGTGWTGVGFAVVALIIIGFVLFNAAKNNLKRMQLSD